MTLKNSLLLALALLLSDAAAAGTITFRDGATDRPYTAPTIVPGASWVWTLGGFSLQTDAVDPATFTSVTIRMDGSARTAGLTVALYMSTDFDYNYAFDTHLGTISDPGAGNEGTYNFNVSIPANTERYFYLGAYVPPGQHGTLQGVIANSSKLTLDGASTLTNITTNEPLSTAAAALPVSLSSFSAE